MGGCLLQGSSHDVLLLPAIAYPVGLVDYHEVPSDLLDVSRLPGRELVARQDYRVIPIEGIDLAPCLRLLPGLAFKDGARQEELIGKFG